MGLSPRQLALCDVYTWLVRPSTAKSTFGAAGSSGGVPAAARRTGPYRAHFAQGRGLRRGVETDASNFGGTLIVASTVAPSTMAHAALVSATTSATAGRTYAVHDVKVWRYRGGIHHVTLTLGRT
jgi:hypothetical protein